MVKGLQRSISRGGADRATTVVKRTYSVSGGSLVVDGAAGVGFGTLVIGGLPEGNILLLGALGYFKFTGAVTAGLTDTWEGDYGVGTTPASDGTITAADVDIVPSTAIAAAVAEDSARTRGTDATGAKVGQVFDNTAGDLELNLNLLIDDASISADDVVITVNGELSIVFVVFGDD